MNSKKSILIQKEKIEYNEYEWHYIDYYYNFKYVKNPLFHPHSSEIIYWVKRVFKGHKCVYKIDNHKNGQINLFDVEFYDKDLRRVNLRVGNIECVMFREYCPGNKDIYGHLLKGENCSIKHIKRIFKDYTNINFLDKYTRVKDTDNTLTLIIKTLSDMEKINRIGSIQKYFDRKNN